MLFIICSKSKHSKVQILYMKNVPNIIQFYCHTVFYRVFTNLTLKNIKSQKKTGKTCNLTDNMFFIVHYWHPSCQKIYVLRDFSTVYLSRVNIQYFTAVHI